MTGMKKLDGVVMLTALCSVIVLRYSLMCASDAVCLVVKVVTSVSGILEKPMSISQCITTSSGRDSRASTNHALAPRPERIVESVCLIRTKPPPVDFVGDVALHQSVLRNTSLCVFFLSLLLSELVYANSAKLHLVNSVSIVSFVAGK